MTPADRPLPAHAHEYERGIHMAEAFGIDGRTLACAICGDPKPTTGYRIGSCPKGGRHAWTYGVPTWKRAGMGGHKFQRYCYRCERWRGDLMREFAAVTA